MLCCAGRHCGDQHKEREDGTLWQTSQALWALKGPGRRHGSMFADARSAFILLLIWAKSLMNQKHWQNLKELLFLTQLIPPTPPSHLRPASNHHLLSWNKPLCTVHQCLHARASSTVQGWLVDVLATSVWKCLLLMKQPLTKGLSFQLCLSAASYSLQASGSDAGRAAGAYPARSVAGRPGGPGPAPPTRRPALHPTVSSSLCEVVWFTVKLSFAFFSLYRLKPFFTVVCIYTLSI